MRNAPQPIVEPKLPPLPLPGREGILQTIAREKTEYTRLFAEIITYTPRSKKAKRILPQLVDLQTRILRATLVAMQMGGKKKFRNEEERMKHARIVVEILRQLGNPRLIERKINEHIKGLGEIKPKTHLP